MAANHLLSIINDILDISKIEADKLTLEQTDFHLLSILDNVRSMISDQAKAKGLDVVVDPDSVPLWLRGDPLRLRQALLNYASNAIKFTHEGSVTLRALRVDDSGDEIMVRFEVVDTGIGIAPDKLPDVFIAFEQADASTTRQYGGTGLGLAINRHLAELMGGQAGADSDPGKGSTFWFTARLQRGHGVMPVETPMTADGQGQVEAQLRLHHGGARILLAEDVAVNQEVAVELLHGVGLTVDTAQNGREAVDKARANHYDLILMDVRMPQMDGLEATRVIRAMSGWLDRPILAMTANAFDDDRRACLDAGMNDFVAKPVDPDTFYLVLLKWLSASSSASTSGPGAPKVTRSAQVRDSFEWQRRLASVPGLDAEQGLVCVRGNMSSYLRILNASIGSLSNDTRQLSAGLAAQDWQALSEAAHSLAGSAGNMGAKQIGETASALHIALNMQSSPQDIALRCTSLVDKLTVLIDGIRDVLNEQQT